MAVTVTNSFNNTDSWDANKVNTNFSDLLSWANGGITTSNLSGSAGITNAQLANDDFVFALPIVIAPTNWTAASTTGTGTLLGTAGIPYIGSDTFTVIGYSWMCHDVGSQDGQFGVAYYTRTGTTIPSVETTIVTPVTMTAYDGVTTNTIGVGQGALNVDVTTTAAKTNFFGVYKVAHGTNVLNVANYDSMTVNLLIKRKAGLGSF